MFFRIENMFSGRQLKPEAATEWDDFIFTAGVKNCPIRTYPRSVTNITTRTVASDGSDCPAKYRDDGEGCRQK
jgi:hypothetical protein